MRVCHQATDERPSTRSDHVHMTRSRRHRRRDKRVPRVVFALFTGRHEDRRIRRSRRIQRFLRTTHPRPHLRSFRIDPDNPRTSLEPRKFKRVRDRFVGLIVNDDQPFVTIELDEFVQYALGRR